MGPQEQDNLGDGKTEIGDAGALPQQQLEPSGLQRPPERNLAPKSQNLLPEKCQMILTPLPFNLKKYKSWCSQIKKQVNDNIYECPW